MHRILSSDRVLVLALASAVVACSSNEGPPDLPGITGTTTASAESSTSVGGTTTTPGESEGSTTSSVEPNPTEGGGSTSAVGSSSESEGTGPAPAGLQIFLLIGQSNMEGVPLPQAEDTVEDPRVQVLGYTNCDGGGVSRQYNQWYVAKPPLHSCWAGVGPGDWFAKTLLESWPDAEIALIPLAISGVDIDFFRKGVVSARRGEFQIPPDNTKSGAYEMVIERATLAQELGTIRGILFHQGESDSGQQVWVTKVAEIVSDLRTDLGLGEDVPFIAGELLYSGCCAGHNARVNELPNVIPNAHVVSASGLAGQDQYHFNLAGQRELGRRYAEAFLASLD